MRIVAAEECGAFDPSLSGFRASTDRCAGLLNFSIGIKTNSDKRCFLYLDSIVVSVEPEGKTVTPSRIGAAATTTCPISASA